MIYYVSGKTVEDGYTEKLERYVVANNKREAKRKAKDNPDSRWKGHVEVIESNIAFVSDKMYLINGRFYSDGIAMYLCDLCPERVGDKWIEENKTADIENFFPLRKVEPTGEVVNDTRLLWHKYDSGVYVQELFHTVVQQNNWQVWRTGEKPNDPLALLSGGNIVGMVMAGDPEQIEKWIK